MSEPALFALGALVYALAGAVKGLLGIGLPTLAVGLSAQFLDARVAVAHVVVPMLVANAWQVLRAGAAAAAAGGEGAAETVPIRAPLAATLAASLGLGVAVARRYAPLGATMLGAIGTVALLAPRVPATLVTLALGIVTSAFALVSLWRAPPPLPERLDAPAQVLTGAVAGVFGGLAGVWAPPVILYLGARGLDKERFVETVGVLLLGGSLVLLLGYVASGIVTAEVALVSLALIPPALAGFALGERGRRRLSGPRFRALVLGFFLVMGLNLVRRALSGGA